MLSPLIAYGFYMTLLTSLSFQVILTLFGNFRKHCSKKWLTFLLWSAYQLADVAATTSLGIITSFPGDKLDEITPIWSSFLLMHLGGPDSLTAISLVDNELYYRHSIQLLYRVGVAGYIHVKQFLVSREDLGRSWFVVLLWMLLAGISKYGERTWALPSANMANLRDSMLPSPNSGPIPVVTTDDEDDSDPQLIPMDEYASEIVVTPELASTSAPTSSMAPAPAPALAPAPAPDDRTLDSVPIPLLPHDEDGDAQFILRDEYASGMVAAPELAPAPTFAPAPTSAPAPAPAPAPRPGDGTLFNDQFDTSKEILLRGYQYFCSFKCLFVDLMVPCSGSIIETQRFFLQCPCEVAFQIIDVELRFIYDLLFTKALVVRTSLACNLRFLRYSALLYALVVFFRSGEFDMLSMCHKKKRHYYCDIGIFLHSLVGLLFFSWAFVQETYEIIQMLLSEWTVIWLNNHNLNRLSWIILELILYYRSLGSKLIRKCGVGRVASEKTRTRYSWCFDNVMAQYNLLSFCFKDEPTIIRRLLNLSSWGESIQEWLANNWSTTHMHVSDDIKDFIYQQFKERVQTSDEEIKSEEFHNSRGKWVMKMNNCSEHNYVAELSWSVDVEFDRSILIWHVATDLCYYSDDPESIECQPINFGHQVKVSKALSDYLLYLLLILPFMLNNRIGKIRFQDTCAAVKKLFEHVPKDKKEKERRPFSFIFQRKKSSLGEKQTQDFIKRLLRSNAQDLIKDTKADGSKSVLLEAHKLAKLLTSFAVEERWKIISGVWVEMLSYAASNCNGKHHAQQLSDGGEFLTKIWLLTAHLGMIE